MKYLSLIITLLSVITANAQNKLDNNARNLPDSLSQTYNVIVTFNTPKVDFGDYKVDIISQLDDMAVVNVTAAQMKDIASLPQVQSVSLGSEVRPLDTKTPSIAQSEEPKSDKKNGQRSFRSFFLNIFKKLGFAK